MSATAGRNRRTPGDMKRVVILGRGASGKSTLVRRLGENTGLPVIGLDKIFWRPGAVATPRDQVAVQERLVAEDVWNMDGNLGPYEVCRGPTSYGRHDCFLDFSLVRFRYSLPENIARFCR